MYSTRHDEVSFDDEILSSIRERKNDRVKEIVRSADLYHSVDASQATLLHYSARYGNAKVAQFLLDNGCHIDAQDSSGNTALMIAMEENNKVMQVLLDAGANVFLLNRENKSVLHMLDKCTNHVLLCYTCHLFVEEFRKQCSTTEEVAKKFIDAGFQIYLAACTLDHQIIEYMLERGYAVDSVHPRRKFTAMHVSVNFHDLKSVQVLLKYGANPRALDANNANPLYHLYRDIKVHHTNGIEILKILLNSGVSPTFCDAKTFFPISYTLMRGDREAIREVLKSGLDFTARDRKYGRTVLHYLANNTNEGVVQELESHADTRYDVNAIDNSGFSVLYGAVNGGNADMVEFLLDKGLEHRHDRDAPLYYAYASSKPQYQARYDRCIELLLLNDADPQFVHVGSSGESITVFDLALKANDSDRIKPFIAELSIVEKRGFDITDVTRFKIDSEPTFKEYFVKCRQLIDEEIFGSVTLFRLLTSNYVTMDRYLNNEGLVREIELFNLRHDMKASHVYLYNKWQKHYSEAVEYKELKDRITGAICQILGNCVDQNHCIVDNIISYLDIKNLRQLTQL